MTKAKQRRVALEKNRLALEKEELTTRALELLRNPDFFQQYYNALQRLGLVGEERNASVLLIAQVSRLLDKPLNIMVKGQSSSGKNYTVNRTLRLVPEDAVRELTSSSAKAWNYAGDDFRHKIIYLQERNEASGAMHPARQLISEGHLIRIVSVIEGGVRTTKRYVAEGPIASISTTTKNQLEIDDETRQLSIWVDESPEQTRRIAIASVADPVPLSQEDLQIWHEAHRLLEARSKLLVILPKWIQNIAANVYDADVRVRRYFPAFATGCRAIALLRSFESRRDLEIQKHGKIEVTFADFALTTIIFESVFVESLHRGTDATMATRSAIERIAKRNAGEPVDVGEFAEELGISQDRAYADLRAATAQGAIIRANPPEKTNRKLFLPSPQHRFLPSLDICEKLANIDDRSRFLHPFTGEWISLKCEKKKKAS